LFRASGQTKNVCVAEQDLRVLVDSVGRGGEGHRLLRHSLGLGKRALVGEGFGAKSAPRELRSRVVADGAAFGDL
jgi:hypothetical protein